MASVVPEMRVSVLKITTLFHYMIFAGFKQALSKNLDLFTQVVRPGFRFRLSFFPFFLCSVTNNFLGPVPERRNKLYQA